MAVRSFQTVASGGRSIQPRSRSQGGCRPAELQPVVDQAYRDLSRFPGAEVCAPGGDPADPHAGSRSAGFRRGRGIRPDPGGRADHRKHPDGRVRQHRDCRSPGRPFSIAEGHCDWRPHDPFVAYRYDDLFGRADQNRNTGRKRTGPRAGPSITLVTCFRSTTQATPRKDSSFMALRR